MYNFDLLITIIFYVSITLGKYVNFLLQREKTTIDKTIDIITEIILTPTNQPISSILIKTFNFVDKSYFVYF